VAPVASTIRVPSVVRGPWIRGASMGTAGFGACSDVHAGRIAARRAAAKTARRPRRGRAAVIMGKTLTDEPALGALQTARLLCAFCWP
jgi:hypothetical protein